MKKSIIPDVGCVIEQSFQLCIDYTPFVLFLLRVRFTAVSQGRITPVRLQTVTDVSACRQQNIWPFFSILEIDWLFNWFVRTDCPLIVGKLHHILQKDFSEESTEDMN